MSVSHRNLEDFLKLKRHQAAVADLWACCTVLLSHHAVESFSMWKMKVSGCIWISWFFLRLDKNDIFYYSVGQNGHSAWAVCGLCGYLDRLHTCIQSASVSLQKIDVFVDNVAFPSTPVSLQEFKWTLISALKYTARTRRQLDVSFMCLVNCHLSCEAGVSEDQLRLVPMEH